MAAHCTPGGHAPSPPPPPAAPAPCAAAAGLQMGEGTKGRPRRRRQRQRQQRLWASGAAAPAAAPAVAPAAAPAAAPARPSPASDFLVCRTRSQVRPSERRRSISMRAQSTCADGQGVPGQPQEAARGKAPQGGVSAEARAAAQPTMLIFCLGCCTSHHSRHAVQPPPLGAVPPEPLWAAHRRSLTSSLSSCMRRLSRPISAWHSCLGENPEGWGSGAQHAGSACWQQRVQACSTRHARQRRKP